MGTKVSITRLTDVAAETRYLCPGKYVPTVHDIDWYTGCITTDNDEEYDILVKFMKRERQDILTFSWSQREDKCRIPVVLVCVQSPHHHGVRVN
jgi:hypothetical protein